MQRYYTARFAELLGMRMVLLEVLGIRLLRPDDSPVLLLQEAGGSRCLPIWIGSNEAAAIAMALDEEQPARPMTHDLVATMLERFGFSGQLTVESISEGIYDAVLQVDQYQIQARPSDGVAIALRMGWPIYAPRTLLDQVGVEVEATPSDEVEAFRAFLDRVNADDFTD